MNKTIMGQPAVIINKKEAIQILHCLQYCYHRLTKHDDTGLAKISSWQTVKKLKKDLENILKYEQ